MSPDPPKQKTSKDRTAPEKPEDLFKTRARIDVYVPLPIKFFLKTVADAYSMSLSDLCAILIITGAIAIKEGAFVIDATVAEKAKEYFGIDAKVLHEMIKRGYEF